MNPQTKGSNSSQDQRDTPYRFLIGALIVLLNLSFGLSISAAPPVTPLIMDTYNISHGTVGLLSGMSILTMSLLAIPCARMVGRVKLKTLIFFSWLIAAIPVLSFMAESFPILLGLRVCLGLSFAIAIPTFGPVLMQWFRPRELPLMNGLTAAALTVGMALAMFITAPLATALGWKVTMSLFGLLTLAGAVLWTTMARTQEPNLQTSGLSMKETWSILRSRFTLLLAAGDAGPFAQYIALITWLPTFYHEVRRMPLSAAGSLVGIIPFTGVIILPLVGLVTMRVGQRRPFLIVAGLVGGIAGFGCFLFDNSFITYSALVLLGIGNWLYMPVLFTIPMEIRNTSAEEVSMRLAAITAIGGTLSFIAPIVVGFLTDAVGSYIPGFSIFGVLSWSLVLVGLILPETSPSVSTKR